VDETVGEGCAGRRRAESEWYGEGCFARYINLILWIPDRWWKEEARSGVKWGWEDDGVALARFEYS
jgi:hypothetical protein